MLTLENSNGQTYEVLTLCGFNKADREYYGLNAYRVGRYAILKSTRSKTYVVASYLNNSDWGHGTYFDDLDEALEFYTERVESYFKG